MGLLLQRFRPDGAEPVPLWPAAFPAFVWREVLRDDRVTVTVRASGRHARLRAAEAGRVTDVASATVDGEWRYEISATEATWYWVEGDVDDVTWGVDEDLSTPRVTAVVPTFRRPAEAVAQTRALLAADVVARVVVVDQGEGLGDVPAFADLQSREPDRVVLLSQHNLGGSGGYARGMLESLRWPADAVFLSDDDAVIEPESLRRMVVLQALSAARGRPCVVGTGMRSAEQPELLVALTERVEPRTFWWGPADGLADPLDLAAATTPAEWHRLLPTRRADYAGWWGALLPPGAVTDIGLPAPYFLKWDDAEYGLRARRRGYDIRTLPGVAVRHPTWAAKGTAAGWHSYLMHRNRLATAAAYRCGRGVLLDSFVHQVKHVLSLQYATADLWNGAADAVLAGPDTWLGSDLRDARATAEAILDRLPPPGTGSDDAVPRAWGRAVAAARAVAGLVLPGSTSPAWTTRVSAGELSWRDGLGADRVVVDAPGGAAVLERDPARARRLLRDTLVTHARLALAWPRLTRRYAHALPPLLREDYWRRVLGLDSDG